VVKTWVADKPSTEVMLFILALGTIGKKASIVLIVVDEHSEYILHLFLF